ncbi:MAG: hypothetical protein ABI441_11815 [Flavobacterium sp.]
MKKTIVVLLFVCFSAYSQTNRFNGTWSNENCKDCSKEYILNLNMAQSNNKIYGTAEVINKDEKLNTGIMEITGYVYVLGEKAQINLKGQNGISATVVLFVNEGAVQFNKRGGSDLIPKEVILTKVNE